MKNNNPITKWALDDRPREKLMAKGKEALSNAELLGILIATGNREMSAVQLAQTILDDCDNSLKKLSRMTVDDLMLYKGIGEAKAITIIAAAEIGRRRLIEKAELDPQVTSSQDIYNYMRPFLEDLNHEEFYLLLLNRANKIIKKILISKGGIAGAVVDIRLIFKPAMMNLASGIVVVHNHPSGSLKPSKQDISITNKIKEAGNFLDVKLLDHLIISQTGYFSFNDESLI